MSAALAWAALMPCAARAQEVEPAIRRPALAGRVVRTFDFEGLKLSSIEVPTEWYRAQTFDGVRDRPGFPPYNGAKLDYTTAARGEGSIRVPVLGGSASLRLFPGEVPVQPEGLYGVRAMVRTQGLAHARASIAARFLDENEQPIPSTESRSELIRSASDWTAVSLDLPSGGGRARFLQIDLEVLQPAAFEGVDRPAGVLGKEDLSASAWFDEVSVVQLPQVRLEADNPLWLWEGAALPEVQVVVRDMTGEQLSARMVARDDRGRVVDELSFGPFGGRAQRTWQPALPGWGWFEIELTLRSDDGLEATTRQRLARVPARPASPGLRDQRGRFGVWLERLPAEHARHVPELVRWAGVGMAKLPVWDGSTSAQGMLSRVDALAPVFLDVQRTGCAVILGLDSLPSDVARTSGLNLGDVPTGIAQLDVRDQRRLIVPVLDRLADLSRVWHVGAAGAGRMLAPNREAEVLQSLRAVLGGLSAGLPLSLATDAHESPASMGAAVHAGLEHVVVRAPVAIPGAGDAFARELLLAWESGSMPRLATILVPEIDARSLGTRAAVASTARTTLELWAGLTMASAAAPGGSLSAQPALTQSTSTDDAHKADAARSALPSWWLAQSDPLAWSGDARGPSPGLVLWRTLGDRLEHRSALARIESWPGVTCLVIAAPRPATRWNGALVLWCDDGVERVVRIPTGTASVRAEDMFGNPLAPESSDGQSVTLRVGHEPIFIEDVDVPTSLFLVGAQIVPGWLSAAASRQDIEVRLTNPWSVPVSGRARVLSPGGLRSDGTRDRTWVVEPRVQGLALEPGATGSLQISVEHRTGVETGARQMELAFDLRIAGQPVTIVHALPFELGIEDLQVEADVYERRGRAMVEVRISNASRAVRSVELTASPVGAPRRREHIGGILPGQTVVRLMSFAAGSVVNSSGELAVPISVRVVGESGQLTTMARMDEPHATTSAPSVSVPPPGPGTP